MPATNNQITAAIAAHGAAKVHAAAYKAMEGGAARKALAAVGLPTDGTIGDMDRIGKAAFAAMQPADKAADLADLTIKQASAPGRKPLPPGQAKDARIEVRCHPDDKAALQAKADAAGMKLSAWLVKTGLSARKYLRCPTLD
jgi:hypothetical protein